MNNLYKTVAFASANLLALGANAADSTALKPLLSSSPESSRAQTMSDGEMRTIEASHLEVYAGCKWGHAAFDPVKVESEKLSPEVQSIYAKMSRV